MFCFLIIEEKKREREEKAWFDENVEVAGGK